MQAKFVAIGVSGGLLVCIGVVLLINLSASRRQSTAAAKQGSSAAASSSGPSPNSSVKETDDGSLSSSSVPAATAGEERPGGPLSEMELDELLRGGTTVPELARHGLTVDDLHKMKRGSVIRSGDKVMVGDIEISHSPRDDSKLGYAILDDAEGRTFLVTGTSKEPLPNGKSFQGDKTTDFTNAKRADHRRGVVTSHELFRP